MNADVKFSLFGTSFVTNYCVHEGREGIENVGHRRRVHSSASWCNRTWECQPFQLEKDAFWSGSKIQTRGSKGTNSNVKETACVQSPLGGFDKHWSSTAHCEKPPAISECNTKTTLLFSYTPQPRRLSFGTFNLSLFLRSAVLDCQGPTHFYLSRAAQRTAAINWCIIYCYLIRTQNRKKLRHNRHDRLNFLPSAVSSFGSQAKNITMDQWLWSRTHDKDRFSSVSMHDTLQCENTRYSFWIFVHV